MAVSSNDTPSRNDTGIADAEPFDARLRVEDVVCRRGGRVLLEGLTFTLTPGDALRLLGPNGAGKTSLLRLLAGLLPPAAGRVRCLVGETAVSRSRRVHLLSHLDAIKPGLTVASALRFWIDYAGGDAARVRPALAQVGLDALAASRCGDLSAGQRRRLNLARLLALPRPIWLLDEPTAALDADGQALLEAFIAVHRAAGGIVVAATHLPLDLPGARALTLDVEPA